MIPVQYPNMITMMMPGQYPSMNTMMMLGLNQGMGSIIFNPATNSNIMNTTIPTQSVIMNAPWNNMYNQNYMNAMYTPNTMNTYNLDVMMTAPLSTMLTPTKLMNDPFNIFTSNGLIKAP